MYILDCAMNNHHNLFVFSPILIVLQEVSCMYILDCAMNNHHISLSFLKSSGGEFHVHFRLCYE